MVFTFGRGRVHVSQNSSLSWRVTILPGCGNDRNFNGGMRYEITPAVNYEGGYTGTYFNFSTSAAATKMRNNYQIRDFKQRERRRRGGGRGRTPLWQEFANMKQHRRNAMFLHSQVY